MKGRHPLHRAALWSGAILLVLLAIGPTLWLLLISLQPASGDMGSPGGAVASLLAGQITLTNFKDAWSGGSLGRPMINSLLIAGMRTVSNVALAALAAYPLAKMQFRGKQVAFAGLLMTMMIPEQVLLVPMFRTVVGLGLFDSLLAAVVPFAVSAFGIYLCTQAFKAIPDELTEAASIDGAGPISIWWNVMLPLSAPTLATLALFSFIGSWSELLWPLVVLESRSNVTLPVAVNTLSGQFSTNVRASYAAAVMTLVPVVILLVLCQRFLRAELFAGAVKG